MPSSGYSVAKSEIEDRKIAITFESSNHSIEVIAELEDDEVEWKVEKDEGEED